MPNLTNTTWSFNNTISISSTTSYAINFTDGAGDSYGLLALSKGSGLIRENSLKYNTKSVYKSGLALLQGWQKSVYQTITITGGTDATSQTFYNWLTANAYQTEITFTYTDKIIGSMGTEGTKTIDSEAQWLTDNITVEYTRIPGSATTPATTVTANPTISVDSAGLIMASVSGTQSVTPTVSAGYVSAGTAGTITVSGSNTNQLSTQAATTITPTTSSQTAVAAGKYTTGAVTVGAIPSQYIVPTGTINITSNGIIDVTQYASANVNVTAGTITEDGNGNIELDADGAVQKTAKYNDVIFWDDYIGEIVCSYSASEFQNLTQMPANPSHLGMTSQGWNWTLANAKAQLATTGFLSIGQMYVTSDGKTRAYITIPNNIRKTIRINWYQTVANSVSVDFGDGSSAVTVSGTGNKNTIHEYSTCGDYIITLTVSSGTMKLGNGGNSTTLIQSGESAVRYPYCAMLRKLEIGSGVTDINTSALYNSFLLKTLTLPNTITTINSDAFYACNTLKHITIPSSCTTINGVNTFRACRALYDLSLPKELITMSNESVFRDNQLINISLPPITTIAPYMLSIGGVISKLVIPSTVTNIAANAFNGNSGMKEYHFKSTTPPIVADSNAFTSIPSDCKIYVPSGYLSAYTSASNYPDSTTYTYVEE